MEPIYDGLRLARLHMQGAPEGRHGSLAGSTSGRQASRPRLQATAPAAGMWSTLPSPPSETPPSALRRPPRLPVLARVIVPQHVAMVSALEHQLHVRVHCVGQLAGGDAVNALPPVWVLL
jgi:hypothetical protein